MLTGGLLVGLAGQTVIAVPEGQHWKEILTESRVYQDLDIHTRAKLRSCPKHFWDRINQGLVGFSNCLLLAVYDQLDDPELLAACYRLKLWLITVGVRNPGAANRYLKWLGKSVQQIFLGDMPSPGESYFPGIGRNNSTRWTPFQGPLEWINDLFCEKQPIRQFTAKEYQTLSQIGNSVRALAYPTHKDTEASLQKVIATVSCAPPAISEMDKAIYKKSLSELTTLLGEPKTGHTHSSFLQSGCLELPRAQGGRGAMMAQAARRIADIVLTEDLCKRISGLVDPLGYVLLYDNAFTIASIHSYTLTKEDGTTRPLTIGDFAYVRDATEHLRLLSIGKFEVPKNLGYLVALAAATAVTAAGRYNFDPTYCGDGFILFKHKNRGALRFLPKEESLPVSCGLSIEAGLKTRLISAMMAAVAQLGQLFRHCVVQWLSKDAFLRVGFEEADKLWDLLKAYAKNPDKFKSISSDDGLIISSDLTEATYNIPHDILELNQEFLEQRFADNRLMQVFKKLFAIQKRTMILTDIKDQGFLADQPNTLTSVRGCFMGDSLSFMHLTLFLSSISFQATYKSYFPDRKLKSYLHYNGRLNRPYGQIVGDDHVAFNCSTEYCNVFRDRISVYHGELSKIDSYGKYSGTFCEQGFCKPSDSLPEGTKLSVFGDILFLDVIKGSILTGKSKVKSDGSSAFLGHCKMLQKQAAWHPTPEIPQLAKLLIWNVNFKEAVLYGQVMPHFPICMGGFELSLGPERPLSDPMIKERYGLYFEAILEKDLDVFLSYWTLLESIRKPNPKGVKWEAQLDELLTITEGLETFEVDVYKVVPPYLGDKPISVCLSYLREELGIVPMYSLSDIICRISSFKTFWDGKIDKSRQIIGMKQVKSRFIKAWKTIHTRITPVKELKHKSFKELGKDFRAKSWGRFFNVNDPAIADVFGGMTNLELDLGKYN
jgi:hypothetical protein